MLVVAIFVSLSLLASCNCKSITRSSVQGDDLKNITKDSNISVLWEQFKRTYNKHYATNDESTKRFDIFAENVKNIIDHTEGLNKGESSEGLNMYSDYTNEEYRQLLRLLATLG